MDLYTNHLRDFFQGPRNFTAHLIGSQRPLKRLTDEIDNLSSYVDQQSQEKLAAIKNLVVEKDRLDFARVYLGLTKGWLFVHVPVTYALMVLIGAARPRRLCLFIGGLVMRRLGTDQIGSAAEGREAGGPRLPARPSGGAAGARDRRLPGRGLLSLQGHAVPDAGAAGERSRRDRELQRLPHQERQRQIELDSRPRRRRSARRQQGLSHLPQNAGHGLQRARRFGRGAEAEHRAADENRRGDACAAIGPRAEHRLPDP